MHVVIFLLAFVLGIMRPKFKGIPSLMWPDPIPYRGKGSGIWPQSNLSPRNLISHVNPAMMSHGNCANNGKVRLATFLHPRFQFCCVPADVSRHFSLVAHFSRFRFALYSN